MKLLEKLGVYITVLGILSYTVLGWSEEDTAIIVSLIIGAITFIGGLVFGWRIYEKGVEPFAAFFMSWAEIFNNKLTSALIWGIRFFCIPAIITTIILMILS